MPKTDGDPLGPHFGWRLRAELDRVQPPFSSPRYLSKNAGRRVGAWRFAPIALAIGITGILGMTAWAATGSTNPAVWTDRAKSIINAASPSPVPESTPTPATPPAPAPPVRQAPAAPSEQPEPSNRPEPSGSPEPRESPEPTGSGSSSGSSGGSSTPSPSPSPTPTDH
jgi:membrane peptidoglycan carboxypeptidase